MQALEGGYQEAVNRKDWSAVKGLIQALASIDPGAARKLMVRLLNQHKDYVPKTIHSGGVRRMPPSRALSVVGYTVAAFVAAFIVLIVVMLATPDTPNGESMSNGVAVLILLAFLLIASPFIGGITGWRRSRHAAPVSSRKLDRPSLFAGTASVEDIRAATDVVLDDLRTQPHRR